MPWRLGRLRRYCRGDPHLRVALVRLLQCACSDGGRTSLLKGPLLMRIAAFLLVPALLSVACGETDPKPDCVRTECTTPPQPGCETDDEGESTDETINYATTGTCVANRCVY
ncbi:MAG: hypothetical protein ACJAYU_004226 [Bradymonadia bacterium]